MLVTVEGFAAPPKQAAPAAQPKQAAPAPAPPAATPPTLPPRLVLSQVGYLPNWEKEVFLVSPTRSIAPAAAQLVDQASGKVVATAALSPSRRDPATRSWIRVARFNTRAPGRYRVVAGALRSPDFSIGDDVLAPLERLLLRAFFLQRCGVALRDETTRIEHAACHLRDGQLASAAPGAAAGTAWNATGGWHDAGDYGKYVASAAVAIGRVLAAYEREPARLGFDDLGIPESGNGQPDLLDEMKVGLDWMLSMQRRDGAVYRKVGGKEWPKKLVPERDTQPRYLYGVTSPETAKAAAAWAQASRLFAQREPQVAARYLAAARRAWAWVEAQDAQVFDFREGDDAGSGPYRSNKIDTEASLLVDTDDRLWAATELFITTGEQKWNDLIEDLARNAPVNLYEWKDPSLLALSYFSWHPRLMRHASLTRRIEQRVAERARAPMKNAGKGGFRVANQRFVWGSNKMTAEEGMILCLAYQQGGKREQLQVAREQLHYLLGRNHFGTSFVTGVGERAVRNPTHIFGEAANLEIPGLFVGGPNDLEQAGIAPKGYGPLSWIDDRRSYSSNEFAIDYNASLFGLVAALGRDCHR